MAAHLRLKTSTYKTGVNSYRIGQLPAKKFGQTDTSTSNLMVLNEISKHAWLNIKHQSLIFFYLQSCIANLPA